MIRILILLLGTGLLFLSGLSVAIMICFYDKSLFNKITTPDYMNFFSFLIVFGIPLGLTCISYSTVELFKRPK